MAAETRDQRAARIDLRDMDDFRYDPPLEPYLIVVHLDRGQDGRRIVVEIIEVAGFDGARCTTNTIVTHDDLDRFVTLQRLEHRHVLKLRRAGFDDALLGGGFR